MLDVVRSLNLSKESTGRLLYLLRVMEQEKKENWRYDGVFQIQIDRIQNEIKIRNK